MQGWLGNLHLRKGRRAGAYTHVQGERAGTRPRWSRRHLSWFPTSLPGRAWAWPLEKALPRRSVSRWQMVAVLWCQAVYSEMPWPLFYQRRHRAPLTFIRERRSLRVLLRARQTPAVTACGAL